MTHAGAAPSNVEGSLALAGHQRAGGRTAIVHDTVRQILGRAPRSFAEFAKDYTQIFRDTTSDHFEVMP
jgi:hypothetical protein